MTNEPLLVLQPNSLAEWHALINEAQVGANIQLPEILESYLVFLLLRFTENATLASSILGLEYLEEISTPHKSSCHLQSVGDKCLLFAGLFPEHAKKRRVKPSYFIKLGQTAYIQLAQLEHEKCSIFQTLSDGFVEMRDVLHASRGHKTIHTLQTDHILSSSIKNPMH